MKRIILALALLFPLILWAASKVQIFLYQDPGFQGDWAKPGRQVITGTPLPYWHEGTLFTWVKVDLNPGSNVFYVYYGGDNAPDKSSGDAVFEFFDDFEGTDLNTAKWDTDGCIVHSPAGYSVSNGLLYVWNRRGWTTLCGRYEVDVPSRVVVEEKVYLEGLDSENHYLCLVSSDDKQCFEIEEDWAYKSSGKNLAIFGVKCNGSWIYHPTNAPILYDVGNMWHIARIEKSGDFTYTAQILDLNYSVLGTHTKTFSSTCSRKMLAPVYVKSNSSNRIVVDWVRIRKYAPSPAVYYGREESGEFVVGDHTFTKRRKVEVVSSVQVSGYQVALDYSQWGEREIEVVR